MNETRSTALNYTIIVQSAEEVQDIHSAPPISMNKYLVDSGRMDLLTKLSVYSLRGDSRNHTRLLYMNAVALSLWKEMGKVPTLSGALHRPPRTALLMFGVPFSE